ncbi:MAG: type IIL restriction-modification enzyme MmeI, partial [Cyanobacteriota bacterium]
MGFTFDDSRPADDESPGIPSPISMMERLIAENPKNGEVIFPYICGEEVNSSCTHARHRYVINYGERSEEECRREWPELIAIVEQKVKPGRLAQNREIRSRYWWRFGQTCPALYEAISGYDRVLAIPCISNTLAFASLKPSVVFSHKLIVFPLQEASSLALMQSRTHEFWARSFASSMKDDLNYSLLRLLRHLPIPHRSPRFRRHRSIPGSHAPKPRSHRRALLPVPR